MTDILDLLLPEDEPRKCDVCHEITTVYAVFKSEFLCKPCILKLMGAKAP